MILSQ